MSDLDQTVIVRGGALMGSQRSILRADPQHASRNSWLLGPSTLQRTLSMFEMMNQLRRGEREIEIACGSRYDEKR